MTSPLTEAPALIGTGTQALIENAGRLGLTWQLRIATVMTVGLKGVATATYDGDTVPIGVTSTVGTLTVGTRIYTLSVPPSGNFAVGKVSAMETGDVSVSFASALSNTQVITFDVPFLEIPRVFTNINSLSGSTGRWNSRASNITTTQFTLFVYGDAAAAWAGINVQWMAVAP